MPLVVPGINNNDSNNSLVEEWTNKLVGKKLHDEESNETVSPILPVPLVMIRPDATVPDLLQEGPPPENPCHRARHDGHQGLPARQTQRARQGGRYRLPRRPRLSRDHGTGGSISAGPPRGAANVDYEPKEAAFICMPVKMFFSSFLLERIYIVTCLNVTALRCLWTPT